MAGFCWDMVADREGWENAIWAPIIVCSVPFLVVIYSFGCKARVILRPRSQSGLSTKNIFLLRSNSLNTMTSPQEADTL
jgi:hypothetical protein